MYDQDHQNTDDDSEFWDRVPDSRLDGLRSAWRERASGLASGRVSGLAARLTRPARTTPPPRPAPRPTGGRSTHPATRRHHTDSIPVVSAHDDDSTGTRRPAIDPLLRRTGVLAIVITLLVPVAMAMRSGDTAGRATPLQPAATAGSAPVVGAAGAPVQFGASDLAVGAASPASPVDPAAQAGSPASIDIAALPEAVPVNTPAAAPATNAAPPATAAAVPQAQAKPAAQPTSQGATASRAACGRTYTIAAGDAWVTIAKRHSVTTASLLSANGATRRTMLYPGRTICLPANASTPTTAKPPTTTTKPAPAPTTTVKPVATVPAPPARAYSREEVIAIIREVWPDHLEDEAIRIAIRESNLKPAARNYCCIGLFQIYFNVHKRWLATIGVTNANQLTDPRVNAYAAVTLWNRAGSWAPWRL